METGSEELALREAVGETARYWWLFLVTGILWMIFGFIVLDANPGTPFIIGLFAGIAFIVAGFNELLIMGYVKSWRWLHALFGLLFIIAGIIALSWPNRTFLVLVSIIAWALLIKGVLDIVVSLGNRPIELWWMQFTAGVIEVLLALVISGVNYVAKAWILVLWIGLWAIFRGITEIILAFQMKDANRLTPV